MSRWYSLIKRIPTNVTVAVTDQLYCMYVFLALLYLLVVLMPFIVRVLYVAW